MTIEQKIEEALLLNEDLYFFTPTKELFETVLNLFDTKFKNYVPYFRISHWRKEYWDNEKEKTHIYYIRNQSVYWTGEINDPNLKQIDLQITMTIEEKLKEAFLKEKEFYIHTPTFDTFSFIINLLKNSDFKSYVPNMSFNVYTYDMWNIYKENTYLFYWKNDNFAYGGKSSINENRWFLDLFKSKEEIIEHTYTISIGEYSGKLIIPKEALQLLKDGTKIKIV